MGFMFIVGSSRTAEPILVHFMVYDSSEYLPAYHTQPGSQVTKMLDFVNLTRNRPGGSSGAWETRDMWRATTF